VNPDEREAPKANRRSSGTRDKIHRTGRPRQVRARDGLLGPVIPLSMAKAVVDPAELRRFAQELRRFNTGLRDQIGSLGVRFNNLGDTWRDQEHAKFAEEFEQTMRVLARFADAADQQVPFLLRKAEKIEEYLNQR
jgi:uncharacterized protein YukE